MAPQKANQVGKVTTKERILEAAIDLFSENGFSAVSIRDITKRVGINESSLYNHFKSKDVILDAIIEKLDLELGQAIYPEEVIKEQIIETDPELFFQQHLLSIRERMTPTAQKITKIFYLEQFRDKRIRDFYIKEIIGRPAAYYEKVFRIMSEQGLIKPIDPKLLSDEFTYGFIAFSLEHLLLLTDNEDITANAKKLFAHVKFICEAIKK